MSYGPSTAFAGLLASASLGFAWQTWDIRPPRRIEGRTSSRCTVPSKAMPEEHSAMPHDVKTMELSLAQAGLPAAQGVVHLRGVARSPGGKKGARVSAEGVRGVAGVVNHLSIERIDTAPSVPGP